MKTFEAFERNFFSYYPHSFPNSFNKVEKLYFRKILPKMNPFIDLSQDFWENLQKLNSFTIIFEGFCKHWKYLSISYQDLGSAISMEHLSNCFCISGGRPSPNPIWLASWVCFYLIAGADIGYVKSVSWGTFHSTDTTICVYKMLQISAHWEIVIINIKGSIIPSV